MVSLKVQDEVTHINCLEQVSVSVSDMLTVKILWMMD